MRQNNRVVPFRFRSLALLLVAGASLGVGASGTRPALGAAPTSPPTFGAPLTITNTYQPFTVGAVKVYTGKKDGKAMTLVDIYLPATRTFHWNGNDVQCHILQETEFEGGRLSEISHNYRAQADDGTEYYFGESVDGYDATGAVVAHDGTWLVGGATLPDDPPTAVNAANPAALMVASPARGDVFKPEDSFPDVDESDTVMSVGLKLHLPIGKLTNVIRVRETSQIAGEGTEYKWYAPGVGPVKGNTKGEFFSIVSSSLLPR